MNYERAVLANHSNKCELLHDIMEDTSHALQPNSLSDHIFFNHPLKVIGSTRLHYNYAYNYFWGEL